MLENLHKHNIFIYKSLTSIPYCEGAEGGGPSGGHDAEGLCMGCNYLTTNKLKMVEKTGKMGDQIAAHKL